MAFSPQHIDVITPEGVTRVGVRYMRPFKQVVPVEFCWLYRADIDHSCDDEGCWA